MWSQTMFHRRIDKKKRNRRFVFYNCVVFRDLKHFFSKTILYNRLFFSDFSTVYIIGHIFLSNPILFGGSFVFIRQFKSACERSIWIKISVLNLNLIYFSLFSSSLIRRQKKYCDFQFHYMLRQFVQCQRFYIMKSSRLKTIYCSFGVIIIFPYFHAPAQNRVGREHLGISPVPHFLSNPWGIANCVAELNAALSSLLLNLRNQSEKTKMLYISFARVAIKPTTVELTVARSYSFITTTSIIVYLGFF